jgi:hypothetical protein
VTSRRLGLTRRFHLKNTGDGRRGLSCAVAEKKKSQRSCSGHWTTFSGLYPRTPVCQPSVAYSLGTSRGLRCHLDYLDAELSLWLLLGRRQSQTVHPCAHIIQQSNRIIIPPESSSRLGARIVVRQIDALASVKARQKSRHPECRSSTQCLSQRITSCANTTLIQETRAGNSNMVYRIHLQRAPDLDCRITASTLCTS